jgi:hypothetical protein
MVRKRRRKGEDGEEWKGAKVGKENGKEDGKEERKWKD